MLSLDGEREHVVPELEPGVLHEGQPGTVVDLSGSTQHPLWRSDDRTDLAAPTIRANGFVSRSWGRMVIIDLL